MTTLITNNDALVTARKLVAVVASGLTDEYLRALYDVIVSRKKELEDSKSLPTQYKIEMDDLSIEDVLPSFIADDNKGVQTMIETPAPKAPARRKPRQSQEPVQKAAAPRPPRRGKPSGLSFVHIDPVIDQSFSQTVHPVKVKDQDSYDYRELFHWSGLTYRKADVIGRTITGYMDDGSLAVFAATGVGDKNVKCSVAQEPSRTAKAGRDMLHDKWQSNDPVFLPHKVIQHMLVIPSNRGEYAAPF